MLKSCGKNVQKLWKQTGITCQYLSTVLVESTVRRKSAWVKPQVILTIVPFFPRDSSTSISAILHLLIPSYTHNPQPLLLTLRRKI